MKTFEDEPHKTTYKGFTIWKSTTLGCFLVHIPDERVYMPLTIKGAKELVDKWWKEQEKAEEEIKYWIDNREG